jgi:hypothetical protein
LLRVKGTVGSEVMREGGEVGSPYLNIVVAQPLTTLMTK